MKRQQRVHGQIHAEEVDIGADRRTELVGRADDDEIADDRRDQPDQQQGHRAPDRLVGTEGGLRAAARRQDQDDKYDGKENSYHSITFIIIPLFGAVSRGNRGKWPQKNDWTGEKPDPAAGRIPA